MKSQAGPQFCSFCGQPVGAHAKARIEKNTRGIVLVAVIIVLLMIALFNRLANPSSSNHSSISPSASSKPDPEPTSKTGRSRAPQDRWTRVSNESSMDSSKGVILRLEADNEVKDWLQTNLPTLIIRCTEKKTKVYITTGMAASPEYGHYDEYTVRIRLNDNPPIRALWGQSTDNEALFAPNAIELARRISKSDRMLFEFTPFNSNPVIATFDVRGLSTHLPAVAEACKWSVNADSASGGSKITGPSRQDPTSTRRIRASVDFRRTETIECQAAAQLRYLQACRTRADHP
jgi:Type VI secretion system VasI, EvfG, VC_A0118